MHHAQHHGLLRALLRTVEEPQIVGPHERSVDFGDRPAAIAWHRDNAGDATHEVGGREPNAWGFHDMIGNVWEWCWDVYDREVYDSYRVLRGGAWSDEHWSCRASVRRRSHPTFAIDDVGFRVARSVRP